MSLINLRSLNLPSAPEFLSAIARPSAAPAVAPAAGYSGITAFGDSLSDAGNLYNLSLGNFPAGPYVQGQFSNGPVWVQQLAARLDLPVPTASLAGGSDYAYGGARTGAEAPSLQSATDLPSQFVQFLANRGAADPRQLYTLSIGGNDVFDAAGVYAADPVRAEAMVHDAVAAEVGFVAALGASGARNLLVLNVPDLGLTPNAAAGGPQAQAVASALAASYNTQLAAGLAPVVQAEKLNLHVVDSFALLDQGVADPAAFGLTEVAAPIWTGGYSGAADGTLNAAGAAQAGYLFFDGQHPSATGHAILADAGLRSLAG